MKQLRDLFADWAKYFNQRVKLTGAPLGATEKQKAIDNGIAAGNLLQNTDLALHYNLYRFQLMSAIEDADNDVTRLALCHRVAGIREFIDHLEHAEWVKKAITANEKA